MVRNIHIPMYMYHIEKYICILDQEFLNEKVCAVCVNYLLQKTKVFTIDILVLMEE